MIDTQNTNENIASEIEARSAFENRYGVVGSLLASGNYSSWVHQAKWEAFRDGWMQSEVETKKSATSAISAASCSAQALPSSRRST